MDRRLAGAISAAEPGEEEPSPGLKHEPPGENVERDDEGELPDEESYEPPHDEPEDDDEEEPPGDEPDDDEADQLDFEIAGPIRTRRSGPAPGSQLAGEAPIPGNRARPDRTVGHL